MYLGMILSCLVIGNLTNLVSNLDAEEDAFNSKLDKLDKYMGYRKLPQVLRQRIRAYYSYTWSSLRGIDEAHFLSELPTQLRLQVTGLKSKALVQKIPFLTNQRITVINAICCALEQLVIQPGDFLVRKDQAVQGVYFFNRGEAVALKSDNQTVNRVLSAKNASYLGESALFFKEKHSESIRAKSYCEILFLPKETFAGIITEFLTMEEKTALETEAEKVAKRAEKVKKFFGLHTEQEQYSRWHFVFVPESSFREKWNLLLIVSVLYNLVVIPLRVAFVFGETAEEQSWSALFILDWIGDGFYICDIVLRARYFSYYREGVLVYGQAHIFDNYRRNDLVLTDILIALPLDVLVLSYDYLRAWLPFFRLTKSIWVLRLLGYYQVFQYSLTKRKITIATSFHRILKIFIGLALFVHWIGCLWIFMAHVTYYYFEDQCEEEEGCLRTDWITLDSARWPLINHDFQSVSYIRAIYFVLVDMTTVCAFFSESLFTAGKGRVWRHHPAKHARNAARHLCKHFVVTRSVRGL